MRYDYETVKPFIFTEQGQIHFLSIRDRVDRLLDEAGAFRLDKAIAGEKGDSFRMICCIDRLVELGEIRELHYPGAMGQDRIFRRFSR